MYWINPEIAQALEEFVVAQETTVRFRLDGIHQYRFMVWVAQPGRARLISKRTGSNPVPWGR